MKKKLSKDSGEIETLDKESEQNPQVLNNSENILPKPKRVKKGNSFYKPPTSEELNNLREAESLFHSSLFRLQTDELLKEVKLKEKWKKRFEKWFQSLKTELSSLKESKQYDLNDLSWLKKKGLRYPLGDVGGPQKGVFKFIPPTELQMVGSYALDLVTTLNTTVDVALLVPKEFWQHGDYLNQRYHAKRALYLTHLCWCLRKSPLVEEAFFSCPQGDPARPALLLTPKGEWKVKFKVYLLLHPPSDFFKLSRFHPATNNVRPSWFMNEESQIAESVPTPVYNSGIVLDLLLVNHMQHLRETLQDAKGVRDAIILLRAWLHHRQLLDGYGGFNHFILTMFLSYLLSTRRINRMMSSYQVIRNAFLELAQSDWSQLGVTLCRISEAPITLDDFHQHFDVVFVDPSGFLNMCANMTSATFLRVKHEAQLSVDLLNSFWSDSFEALFMTPVPFSHKFDHLIHLPEVDELEMALRMLDLDAQLLNRSGNLRAAILPTILRTLKKSLGKRAKLIDHTRPPIPKWSPKDNIPSDLLSGPLTFGLLLEPEFSDTVLERGPSADQPEALDFRSLWGDMSELRRFQDGAICEAVLWPAKGIAEKRLIVKHIVEYVLQQHTALSTIMHVGGQLDPFLEIPGLRPPEGSPVPYGTGEEAHLMAVQSLDDLSKTLRQLQGLSLSITSVQGISPVFRYSQVFPPLPCHFKRDNKCTEIFESRCEKLKEGSRFCPAHVQPLEVILHMEGSGKWPDSVEAVQRVKGALHMQLAKVLREQAHLTTLPTVSHLDVIKDGYVFRLQIACRKELVLLRQVMNSEGMLQIQHTEEYHQLNMRTEMLPQLTSTLHGLQQQHGNFGVTSRLAKRWVSAHLLLDLHVPEISVELLVAHIFLHPAPYLPPNSPLSGFMRFLSLLAGYNWKTTPLIVNLNQGFKKEDVSEIQSQFVSRRPELPAMFVSTPLDKMDSVWTHKAPSGQILDRLTQLAAASLKELTVTIQQPLNLDLRVVFRPPLDLYDVLIHLRRQMIPKHGLSLDCKGRQDRAPIFDLYSRPKGEVMPVLDFDPVQFYLRDLQESFQEFALFFYDTFGGDFIGVIWKPKAFQLIPFKTSEINCRKEGSSLVEGRKSLFPNIEAILQDFALIGSGLVQRIETRTEKWAIG